MSIFTEVSSDSIHSKLVFLITKYLRKTTLPKKCPYSEIFWSVFRPNVGKCRLEKRFSRSATSLTAKKMKFANKNFFSKCDQIRWSHLQTKSLKENFFFCAASGNMLNMFRVDNTETKTNVEYGYEQFVKISCILSFFWLSLQKS